MLPSSCDECCEFAQWCWCTERTEPDLAERGVPERWECAERDDLCAGARCERGVEKGGGLAICKARTEEVLRKGVRAFIGACCG